MTVEMLDEALSSRQPADIVSLFSGKTEKERRALAERAISWLELGLAMKETSGWIVHVRTMDEEWLTKKERKQLKLVRDFKAGKSDFPKEAGEEETLPAVRLSVLSACNLTTIRKFGAGGLPEPDDAYLVLSDRKPKFLAKWLDFALDRRPSQFWKMTRKLENEGLVSMPGSTGYYTGMITTLGTTEESVLAALRTDSELIDKCIWPMLDDHDLVTRLTRPWQDENERAREFLFLDTFEFRKKLVQTSEVWRKAFILLGRDSAEFRERLIDRMLTLVSRISTDSDNKTVPYHLSNLKTQIGWITSIIDGLELTAEEHEMLIPRYVGLLSTKDTEALVWTIERLESMENDVLPVSDIFSNIVNVFSNKRKDPAQKALRFLKKLVKEDKTLMVPVAMAVLAAFDHKSAAIRKQALTFLEKNKCLEHQDVRDEFHFRLDSLSGLDREKAANLLAGYSGESDKDAEDGKSDQPSEDELTALLERAEKMSGPLAEAACIGDAIQVIEGAKEFTEALSLRSMAIPGLNPDKTVKPIEDLDELIYLLLRVLEGKASGVEVEASLDGLSRLCHLRLDNFGQRTSALKKRALELLGVGEFADALAFGGITYRFDIAAVVVAWIDGKIFKPGPMETLLVWSRQVSISTLFSERAVVVASRVAKRTPRMLLAMPTHEGGWIDPVILVERLEELRKTGTTPDKVEFIQAILRLAPERRDLALSGLTGQRDELDDALAYALGSDLSNSAIGSALKQFLNIDWNTKMKTAGYWVAAARAREPHSQDESVMKRFGQTGPDGGEPARYVPNFSDKYRAGLMDSSLIYGAVRPEDAIRVEPPLPSHKTVEFPTVLMHGSIDGEGFHDHIWPLNRESFFSFETKRMYMHIDSVGTYWHGSWESLFDPDAPLRGNARFLIALGLSAKLQELARLAIDALIEGIDDGRLDGSIFGDAMARVFRSGYITPLRWAKALNEVSRISPLHSQFARRAIEGFFSQQERPDKKANVQLLELLFDLCSKDNECVVDGGAREYLKSIPGKGKKAKLAQSILAHTDEGSRDHRIACGAYALEKRIQRVERWTRCLAESNQAPEGAAATSS